MAAQSPAVDSTEKVSARTRWSYGIGCIGRDAAYTLVSNFIMTYLTLAVGLTDWQLGAVGVVMVAARVWDAINDPMMGTIIDNTRSRWGKFKPYIICGAILNSFFTVLLFSNPVQNEGLFVLVFALSYVLWGMTYTMNDISYWSMLPSLTIDGKERERITSLARIGANIGLFLTTALVPILTAGRMTTMYPLLAKCIAGLFIACQLLVVLGVQERKNAITSAESHTRLRDMVKIVFRNDQLLVIIGAILLFNIGYFTTTGFGMQFFYFDYGNYGGPEFTYFAITIGIAQILTLALSSLYTKRFTRKTLFGIATAMVVFGYVGLMAVGYVLPMNMIIMCVIGFVLFAGQAVIQLLNYVMLADTVEYGQWKLGTRNEGIVYSLNPFITKLASAVQAGLFAITMIVSGLNAFSNQISDIEQNPALDDVQTKLLANEVVAQIPASATLIMRISMVALPLVLILCCYFIYRKKYIIDEAFYNNMIDELARREGAKQAGQPGGEDDG